jgi:hypothetical protein
MSDRCKRYFIIALFVLPCLVIANGLSFGFSTEIKLDARDDAGLYPGQDAFLQFLSGGKTYGGPLTDPGWTHYISAGFTDKLSVNNYAYYDANIKDSWRLESAGNIWSSDKIVGESLENLHAGTYRISPESGAYMYSFSDNPEYTDKYWWELHIEVKQSNVTSHYMLGSTVYADSADSALNAVLGQYIDISIAEGGSLSFWIWDWNETLNYGNSIDNSGSLTFNITSVPEPSTFLLLTIGLAFLMRRIRN